MARKFNYHMIFTRPSGIQDTVALNECTKLDGILHPDFIKDGVEAYEKICGGQISQIVINFQPDTNHE